MIPIANPSRFAQLHATAYSRIFDDFVRSGAYILGDSVAQFEKKFAGFIGAESCISVANGTDALVIALRAVGASGGEVIVAANAGGYSTIAALATQSTPVFVDIDPHTMLSDIDAIVRAVTPRTRCIIATHLYGFALDVVQLKIALNVKIGREIPIIEDCAQAHGAMIGNLHVGSIGDIGCFSFYPTKNLGALGDGGAIVTSSKVFAEQVKKLRQYGWSDKYVQELPGGQNSRLDELQAAILLFGLEWLEQNNEKRRVIAQHYVDAGAPLVHKEFVRSARYVAHLIVCITHMRSELMQRMNELGIGTAIHYPVIDADFPALSSVKFVAHDLSFTRDAVGSIMTLPCFPEMTSSEVGAVCSAIEKCKDLFGSTK